MSNPFFYGNPVAPHQFIDRRRELRRIAGRVANQGRSTAIVGEPRSGKTSLLHYLAALEARNLYGAREKWLVFSYLDAHTLRGDFSQAQFWEYALRPLYERAIAPNPGSPLAQAYQTCQENDFGAFVLERFLAQMELTVWRLVLMLDEFDVLLHHPILNCAGFFGSLRSLASRSRGALALVIASRRPLTGLNEDIQQFSRTGSPYFNFLDEITLGPWPDKDVAELLRRAGDRFTVDDRRFIAEVAGGHPYLLQVAAYELWEAYEEGERDPNRRRQQAGHSLYDEAAKTLSDTWWQWSPAMRRALTAVALAHIPSLLQQRQFYVERLIRDLRDLGPELRSLVKQGFVAEDAAIPCGWRVRPQAFLWWLADELVRAARDEPSLKEWLRKQGWEGLLTYGEKGQLGKVIRTVIGMINGGKSGLIKATAMGAGGSMVSPLGDSDYREIAEEIAEEIKEPNGRLLSGEQPSLLADSDYEKIEEEIGLEASTEFESDIVYAIARIKDYQRGEFLQANVEYVLQTGVQRFVPEGFQVESFSLPTDKETIEFEITVFSEDMDVEPSWAQSFVFHRDRDSELVEFRLTPRRIGTKKVRIEYYYQRHWLAQIKFEVEVVEAQELVPV